VLELGVTSLPRMARDVTDRNRTSPFAFTGNKFEFRAVGSNQNCSGPNVVLNTIVAEALDEICTKLENDVKSGKDFNASVQLLLKDIVKKHKKVIFNGDNYTEEWHKEAEKRGLPNLKNTPEALEETIKEPIIKLFEKHKVFTKTELISRNEIYKEQYEKTVRIEAGVALEMAKTLIYPAALRYQRDLAETVIKLGKANAGDTNKAQALLNNLTQLGEKLQSRIGSLEDTNKGHDMLKVLDAMLELRKVVDGLEEIVPRDFWPLPTYAEMLFVY
jgi:glutamine synthetase